MDRVLCWGALALAIILLIVFGLDLGMGYPFGGGVPVGGGFGLFAPIDIAGVVACLVAGYLAVTTLRELR